MSKSLGNVVDPVETVQQYGAGTCMRHMQRCTQCNADTILQAESPQACQLHEQKCTVACVLLGQAYIKLVECIHLAQLSLAPAADALRFTLATGTSPGQDISLRWASALH